MRKVIFTLSFIGFLLIGINVQAVEVGESQDFNIDSGYDLNQRSQISAVLVKTSNQLYFYLEKDWWDSLTYYQQKEIQEALDNLDKEFKEKIYPTLTQTFGFEWKPGIDRDEKITVLIHQMKEEAAGYFRTNDEYYKVQIANSNEREMVYLNSNYIKTSQAKSFLAHEFSHLIIFNQKEKIRNVSEEIWLNEARSEYVPTLLGYDEVYEGSNLQRRIRNFAETPSDSITEWQNKKGDYGALNLFVQYLVDYYGVKILVDSLNSPLNGIPSLNEALKKNGFSEDFSQIFTDWSVTVLVNDCDLGQKYCYLNKNLKKFKVTPVTNFLPFVGESTLQVVDNTKNWTGNWLRFIGGKGDLKLEFKGFSGVKFNVSYLIETPEGKFEIHNLPLDKNQRGEISLPDFGKKYNSLIIIPSIQSKISGFDGLEPSYQFSWKASIIREDKEVEAELIKKLLEQISYLKNEIIKVQTQINIILVSRGQQKIGTCTIFSNLYYGMKNNPEVRCLQEFLKAQGQAIYPEGLITGNYLSLTVAAVKRYQALKGIIQTGYFGPLTRAAANKDLTGL